MDIESAAVYLRHHPPPHVLRFERVSDAVIEAALARFVRAGGRLESPSPGGVCDRLRISLGPVSLCELSRTADEITWQVEGGLEEAAGLRILFRVMASLGRGGQVTVELASCEMPANSLFRYRPGGPGLECVITGERVAPYDADS